MTPSEQHSRYSPWFVCCSSGAIAGGVLGGLTAIAIIAGIIVYCYISKKKKKKEEEEMDEGFEFNISKCKTAMIYKKGPKTINTPFKQLTPSSLAYLFLSVNIYVYL